MARTWQDNAREFGALTRQGKDVRLALLVACSVKKGRPGRPGKETAAVPGAKVSGARFAKMAGLSASRVLHYLDAWDGYAEKADLPAAEYLTPLHAETLDITEEQAALFDTVRVTPQPPAYKPLPLEVRLAFKTLNPKEQAEMLADEFKTLSPEQQAKILTDRITSDTRVDEAASPVLTEHLKMRRARERRTRQATAERVEEALPLDSAAILQRKAVHRMGDAWLAVDEVWELLAGSALTLDRGAQQSIEASCEGIAATVEKIRSGIEAKNEQSA